MSRSCFAFLFLPLLVACGAGIPSDDDDDALGGGTYYADVKPVLETYCTRCHFDGGPGPGNFDDPDSVVQMGELIAGATAADLMPPPAADPDCADYNGSERMHLGQEEKDILSAWVDGGKVLGDPANAVEIEPCETTLPDADLVLEMPHPYTPTFSDPDNPGNEYRCFILENTREESFYATAFAPVLGVPELVHHIVLFLKDKSTPIAGYDPETGVDCIDNVASSADRMLAGWAPGMLPTRLPEGRGVEVRPDQDIVIQMHYFDNGTFDGSADQSGYAFETVSEVDVPLYMIPVGANSFTIPAGDPDYTHSESLQLPEGFAGKIYTAFPHMHILGRGYELSVERSDGSTACVSRGDAYDFDNQLSYELLEPVAFSGGDTLIQSCTWNNSTSNEELIHNPPTDVSYGERTDEEMCFTFILASLFE